MFDRGDFSARIARAQRGIPAATGVLECWIAGRPEHTSDPNPYSTTPLLQSPIKKRAGLLRLSGDEVAYALTRALRRVMRPTKNAVRTSLLTGPLCQPLANSALTTSVKI